MLIAKRFGVAQGKGAQAWIEQAVKGGDARTETLVSMQLSNPDPNPNPNLSPNPNPNPNPEQHAAPTLACRSLWNAALTLTLTLTLALALALALTLTLTRRDGATDHRGRARDAGDAPLDAAPLDAPLGLWACSGSG